MESSIVEVGAEDLCGPDAVFCPNPRMPLWSTHPRVYLEIGTTGVVKCPYCGTTYALKPGTMLHPH